MDLEQMADQLRRGGWKVEPPEPEVMPHEHCACGCGAHMGCFFYEEPTSTLPAGFIIEHPSRGVLMELIPAGPFEWKPRWSWSRPRTQGRRYATLEEARRAAERLPERQRKFSSILRWGSWSKVA